MIRVYVAGPYSANPGQSVHNALEAATALLDAGFAPYVPHLTHYWHASFPRTYETWMELDFVWLRASDVMLRLPGMSPGADEEEAKAIEWGIPVMRSVREVLGWAAQ